MEKESKKLLLVAVSVGVFLLVAITAAIVILPKTQTQDSSFSSSAIFPQGRGRPAEQPLPGAAPEIVGQSQPEIVDFMEHDTNMAETYDTAAAVDSSDGSSLTIQIPKPSTAAVPDNTTAPPATVTIRPSPSASTTPAAAPSATTAAARPDTPTASAPASRPAASTATAAAARPATVTPAASTAAGTSAARSANDYWIQTGAFAARVRAEDSKEILASKGLVSIIETRVRATDGKELYHVRLGPYTSEREAGYWLEIVQLIDGFGDSQIRRTTRR